MNEPTKKFFQLVEQLSIEKQKADNVIVFEICALTLEIFKQNRTNYDKISTEDFSYIIKRNGEEKAQTLVQAYLNAVESNEPFSDILSMKVDKSSKKNLEQFLTPPKLAEGAARFLGETLDSYDAVIARFKDHSYTMFSDLCAGAGALPLGFLRNELKKYEHKNEQVLQAYELVITDIDYQLLMVAFTQILANSIIFSKPVGVISIPGQKEFTAIAVANMKHYELYKEKQKQ